MPRNGTPLPARPHQLKLGFRCLEDKVQCVHFYLELHTMRTNIVIDDKLMKDALRFTGAKTKREAVELGLRTLVQLSKQAQARQLRGKLTWEGDLEAMRSDK